VYLFGEPLAPDGDEYLELTVAQVGGEADRGNAPAYRLVGQRSHIRLYLRDLRGPANVVP